MQTADNVFLSRVVPQLTKPNQRMQPDPAMMSFFHAVRQWRGAADVRRSAQ